MQLRLRAALVLAGLAVPLARPARAQVVGIPVNNSGIATGVAVYGDVGFPNDAAGGGTAYALSGRVGWSRFGISGSVSLYNPGSIDPTVDADDVVGVGGTLNYKLIGGPLVPFSATLQAGTGYHEQTLVARPTGVSSSRSVLHFPLGIGFGYNVPSSAFSLRPWIAPRLDVSRVSPEGAEAQTSTDFAVSGGLELNLLSGFGIQAAYDWSGAEGHPQQLGVGAHYGFRVPGL